MALRPPHTGCGCVPRLLRVACVLARAGRGGGIAGRGEGIARQGRRGASAADGAGRRQHRPQQGAGGFPLSALPTRHACCCDLFVLWVVARKRCDREHAQFWSLYRRLRRCHLVVVVFAVVVFGVAVVVVIVVVVVVVFVGVLVEVVVVE